MVTLSNTVFWIINIFLIFMLLFSMALGWKQGGKRMGLDILRIVFHFTATVFLTIFLTKRYSWYDYQNFFDYLVSQRMVSENALSPVEVDKFRFYRSGVIWFFIVLIGIEIIQLIAIRIYRKNHQKENKPLSKRDKVAGEIGGALLVMLWVTLFAPIAPSLEKAEVFSNGTDLINKTVVSVPVNYIAKPVTKLFMPDSAVSKVWDEGIGAMAQEVYNVEEWVEENKNDVKVIFDLAGVLNKLQGQEN